MNKMLKKSIILCASLAMLTAAGCAASTAQNSTPASTAAVTQSAPTTIKLKTKTLFINTSRSAEGNTYQMGERFLTGVPHDTLFLNDYKIYQLGQHFGDDQLSLVLSSMSQADTIVIGTPVYWHTMSGGLKTFIDRLYELDRPVGALSGKKLYFLMQGAAPSQDTIRQVPYIMTRVAAQYDMQYMGAAVGMSADDLAPLQNVLHQNL